MRDLVARYLDNRLSRRGFLAGVAGVGFSVAAAQSIADSLDPLVAGETSPGLEPLPSSVTVVEGTGGELLVEQLRAAGVRFIFNCNSSGTYPIFDALVDRPDVHLIQVPQEGQMISMAEGYALASGQTPFTVNGSVGFPNTLNNMYNAWKDRTPMIVGSQRESTDVQGGRDAFEEWDDYLAPAASFSRWRWDVERAERIPEITRRAFKIAVTPPEGPVALAFPEDVLTARARATVVARDKFMIKPVLRPSPALVEEAAKLLLAARSPLILVGPEVTRSQATLDVVELATRLSIPVTQRENLFADFPTNHPLFVGDYVWPTRHPTDVDLLLNLGARMPHRDGQVPEGAKVIHVTIEPETIGRIVPTDVGIAADVKEAARDLVAAIDAMATEARLETMRAMRRVAIEKYTTHVAANLAKKAQIRWNDDPLSSERVGGELNRLLDKDAIVVPELANQSWDGSDGNAALTQLSFGPAEKTKIGRTTGSALGWGVGAAMGVKLAQPDRQVVALQGDGGFMFAQAESLWTMARHEIPVIVVIFNNRSYNGPRNKIFQAGGKQAQTGKDMTCYLGDPDVDFAEVASGFGVKGEVVKSPEQIEPAIRRAIQSAREGKPYLIDAVVRRTGVAADSTWYPRYSVAAARTKTS